MKRVFDEMVALLKEALAFKERPHWYKRIFALELGNKQVAKRLVEIYQPV